MSNCIKDLFDFDLVKKCCRCKIILIKSNFHKDNKIEDGLFNPCKSCRKEFFIKKSNKVILKQKDCFLEIRDSELERCKKYKNLNREKVNLYEKKERKTDFNFKLAHNIRVRTRQAFKSQNVEKLSKTFDLIGCSQSFLRKWILYHFLGDMTEENYGSVRSIDHCYPVSKTKLSYENDMYKSKNWINLEPMFSKDNIIKGSKIDHHLYLLQEIKGNYFMKLNGQEGIN